MAINWFPGHMKKTQREIKENLKLVDAVIEIRDARIPRSSANPDIDKLVGDKPRIILLNKSDLTEKSVTKQWIKHLSSENVKVLEVNCLTGSGLNAIKPAILELLKEKHDRLKAKGLVKIITRVMVVGVPNCGKSTFINKMAKNNIAKTGDRAGVTKNKQWIKTPLGVEMLDTPGILWPRFENQDVGMRLAMIGSINDNILNIEELAIDTINYVYNNYPDNIIERYELDKEAVKASYDESAINPDNSIALYIMEQAALKRGCIKKGNAIDYEKTANIILDDFRSGRLGRITLERSEDNANS